jgi:hypothetical protein
MGTFFQIILWAAIATLVYAMYKIANPKKQKVTEVEQDQESAVDKHLRLVNEKYENKALASQINKAKEFTGIVGEIIDKKNKSKEQIAAEKAALEAYKQRNNIN